MYLYESRLEKCIFDGDFVVDRMTLDISALIPGVRFVPGKTVIIFDEVQECANARASIKSFMLDGRYDIICTGSLLRIKGYNRKKNRGVPTGFEHIIYMKPMDFEEFLWAKGISEAVLDEVKRCFKEKIPVSETIHISMLRYFREYMCVGGMPYVVDRFLSTNDMNVVLEEQRDILEEFRDAFSKNGRSLFYFHKDSGLEIDFITPIDIDITILYGFPTRIVDSCKYT